MNEAGLWLEFLKDQAQTTVEETWFGFSGATEQQLEKAEKKLGVRLPPSYRAFLRATNGWQSASRSVPVLCGVVDVNWFKKKHREWIAAYQFSGTPDLPDLEYFNYSKCDPV